MEGQLCPLVSMNSRNQKMTQMIQPHKRSISRSHAGFTIRVVMNGPYHDLSLDFMEISVPGARTKILGDGVYLCSCLSSSISSSRGASEDSKFLNDNYVNPSSRRINWLSLLSVSELRFESSSHIKIHIGAVKQSEYILFVAIPISIEGPFGVLQAFVTTRLISIDGVGRFASYSSCFISELSDKHPFIESLLAGVHYTPIDRMLMPLAPSRNTYNPSRKLKDFILQTAPSYDTRIGAHRIEKMHFDYGLAAGGQENCLYLSIEEDDEIGLDGRYPSSMSISFLPLGETESFSANATILHVGTIFPTLVAVVFRTPRVPFLKDTETLVSLVIDGCLVPGHKRYLFLATDDYLATGSFAQPIGYSQNEETSITLINISQFAKQQWEQIGNATIDEHCPELCSFIEDFRDKFGRVIDLYGFNWLGFLDINGMASEYDDLNDAISPTKNLTGPIQLSPSKQITALTIDPIEDTLKVISSMNIERIDENYISALLHKCPTDSRHSLSTWLVDHIIPQKHLNKYYNPGKKHSKNDAPPKLKLKIVIYDSEAFPDYTLINRTPKLKACIFFSKFVLCFDENTHLITIEDQEKKKHFLYQSFYEATVADLSKSDEINSFLLKMAEFNCRWNASQYYNQFNNNSGHYVTALLRYTEIWDEKEIWARFITNVRQCKPLQMHIQIAPQFFLMDVAGMIPQYLSSDRALQVPRIKAAIESYTSRLCNDKDPYFEYNFSHYSNDPETQADTAKRELEFFTCFLHGCGESYLTKQESGVRAQRLLRRIFQTNYGLSISPEIWNTLVELSPKHNNTFHTQAYNFPKFSEAIHLNSSMQSIETTIINLLKNTPLAND